MRPWVHDGWEVEAWEAGVSLSFRGNIARMICTGARISEAVGLKWPVRIRMEYLWSYL